MDALPRDLGLITRTCVPLTTICNSSSRRSHTFLWYVWTLLTCGGHAGRHSHISSTKTHILHLCFPPPTPSTGSLLHSSYCLTTQYMDHWPGIHRFVCLCSFGIKGMNHHTQLNKPYSSGLLSHLVTLCFENIMVCGSSFWL